MAAAKYRLTQPTRSDDDVYNVSSTANQSNGIFIDRRKQSRSDTYSLSDRNMQQIPMVQLSKQPLKINSIEGENNSRPTNVYPIVEQPSAKEKKKKRRCDCDCCNGDLNLTCCCCCSTDSSVDCEDSCCAWCCCCVDSPRCCACHCCDCDDSPRCCACHCCDCDNCDCDDCDCDDCDCGDCDC